MKRNYLHFIVWTLLFSCYIVYGQQKRADSLRAALKTATSDSVKVELLHLIYQATDSAIYAEKAFDIAQTAGYNRGIALAQLDIGRSSYFDGKPDFALRYLTRASKLAEEAGDKKILVSAYRYMGYIYRPDDPFVAENYYNKSLKLALYIGDELSESYALSALGNIYENIYTANSEGNKKALLYYLQSLEIRERVGSDEEIASSLNETSRVYDLLGQYAKELTLRLKGLELAKKAKSVENIVFLSDVLGNEYSVRLHDVKKGLEYHLYAYNSAKELKDNADILFGIAKGIARDYALVGDIQKSNDYYRQAVALDDSLRAASTKHIYTVSETKHNLEQELEKEKQILKDAELAKLQAEEAKRASFRNSIIVVLVFIILMVLLLYRGYRRNQRSNRELALKNQKLENAYTVLAESEAKFKVITESINDVFYLFNIPEKRYEYISPNCINLWGLSPQWIYEKNTMKNIVHPDDLPLVIDANKRVDSGVAYEIEYRVIVNDEIKWVGEKSSPIYDEKGNLVRNSGICRNITRRKHDEEIIRQKSQDIQDSILYASTIQSAILIPKQKMAEKLFDFFILSKPKDVVSGDFYFYRETDNGLVVAVADCTGHGVPGGFMSMLGNAYLNEIINNNGVSNPAQVLDALREKVIKSLNQDMDYTSNKDGMDIALLRFDSNFSFVEYAGAFNPLYIVRQGELKEVEPDKFPIGIQLNSGEGNFSNNRIGLHRGDVIYLFSDGYSDQFGGPLDKRFGKARMKELLLTIHNQKMDEQEKLLDKKFEDWKGEQLQMDDVTVMGIRI